jgi:hypothetical protein
MRAPFPYCGSMSMPITPSSRCDRHSVRSPARFVERLFPGDAVGDDVQESPSRGHVVGVARCDRCPGVPGRVGCRNPEGGCQPCLAVGAVVGQGLA